MLSLTVHVALLLFAAHSALAIEDGTLSLSLSYSSCSGEDLVDFVFVSVYLLPF